jgi:hypothetical protein
MVALQRQAGRGQCLQKYDNTDGIITILCSPKFSSCLSVHSSTVLISSLWRVATASKFTRSVHVFLLVVLVCGPIFHCICMSLSCASSGPAAMADVQLGTVLSSRC